MIKTAPSHFIVMTDEKKCKIVIFGAFGAGKTTLVKTLDPESRHVESDCPGGTTTVALDFGRLQVNGLSVHLFGTPGQERFEFARQIISQGMDGAILLVDATSMLDDFTKHLYDSLCSARVPFVVFLNKCENIGGDPELLEKQFGTSPVWKVSALDRKQSLRALGNFVDTLPLNVHMHSHT
jgi:small GTP-binding protein